MNVIKPIMACTLLNRVSGWLALLISIMIRPARRASVPVRLSAKCMWAPSVFCFGVAVGWSTRMACVMSKMPAELASFGVVSRVKSKVNGAQIPDGKRRG